MRQIFFALLFGLFGPAMAAEMTLVTEEVTVVLRDTPCTSDLARGLFLPKYQEHLQGGSITFEGRTVELCWRLSLDGQSVWLVDEDSEGAVVPVISFAPKSKEGSI